MTLTATTLAATLAADATDMSVAAAISSDTHERGFVVQIEAEYILVERRVARTNPQIVRGFLGTERAAHSSGKAVTPVVLVAQTDPPVAPPGESGAGYLQISTIPIAFDTPNIQDGDGGADILALTAGQWILDICVRVPAVWESASSVHLSIGVEDDQDPPILTSLLGQYVDLKSAAIVPKAGLPVEVADDIGTAAALTAAGVFYFNKNGTRGFPTPVLANTTLKAWLQAEATAGTGEIVVFIATPAS